MRNEIEHRSLDSRLGMRMEREIDLQFNFKLEANEMLRKRARANKCEHTPEKRECSTRLDDSSLSRAALSSINRHLNMFSWGEPSF